MAAETDIETIHGNANRKTRNSQFLRRNSRSYRRSDSSVSRQRLRDLQAKEEKKIASWGRLKTVNLKLKTIMEVSSLLAGVAIVVMVELNINHIEDYPEILLVAFATCSTLLVVVHTFALLIGVIILPHVACIAKMDDIDLVDRSPHDSLRWHVDVAWILSTVVGVALFLIELLFICWIQFVPTSTNAGWTTTAIILPAIVAFFVFALIFQRYKVVMRDNLQQELEDLDEIEKNLFTELGRVRM